MKHSARDKRRADLQDEGQHDAARRHSKHLRRHVEEAVIEREALRSVSEDAQPAHASRHAGRSGREDSPHMHHAPRHGA